MVTHWVSGGGGGINARDYCMPCEQFHHNTDARRAEVGAFVTASLSMTVYSWHGGFPERPKMRFYDQFL